MTTTELTPSPRITWPVAAVVSAGAAIVLAGGLLAWLHPEQLLPAGASAGTGVHLYAARMAARAIPLGAALLALLALRARRLLGALLVLVAAIELGDTVSALASRDWAELSGLAVAAAFLWAASRLLGAPLWSVRAWR
ncbi:MAG TPA: hypothetical protein VJT31_41375 [Rugosimonospora sp.]|nr:hypothetical protein [Rugosimonospora sp.]